MADVKFSWNTQEVVAMQTKVQAIPAEVDAKITRLFHDIAPKAAIEMKVRAPWTDVTGEARRTLSVTPEEIGAVGGVKQYSLIFAHGVDYGIYLETMQNGKWQIIMPMAVATGHTIMESLAEIIHPGIEPEVLADIKPELPSEGTSQGPSVYAERELRRFKRTVNAIFTGKLAVRYKPRNVKGRFIKNPFSAARRGGL